MTSEKNHAFDPYRKWLRIPDGQRPPTHYQLLGLSPGEADLEVIEESAIRQTSHVRGYQVGPQSEICTRILNEISQARQVLIHPQKRAEYDRKSSAAPAKPAKAKSSAESAFADLSAGTALAAPTVRQTVKSTKDAAIRRPAGKGPSAVVIYAVAGGGAALTAVVALAWLSSGSPTPPPRVSPPVAANHPNPKLPTVKAPIVEPPPVARPKQPAIEPTKPTTVESPPPVAEVPTPKVDPAPKKEPANPPDPVPAPPVKSPPVIRPAPLASDDMFLGHWRFTNRTPGLPRVEIVVRKNGEDYSARIEMTHFSVLGKAHADTLRIEDGKLRGDMIVDTPLPKQWTGLKEMSMGKPGYHISGGRACMGYFFGPNGQKVGYELITVPGVEIAKVPVVAPPVGPVTRVPKREGPTVARVAVPPEEQIKETEATVPRNFKAEYAKKSPADKTAFAEKLLQLADESKDDAAARYVLFVEARDLAASAGNWPTVSEALAQLDAGFEIDLLPQREAALRTVMKSGLTKDAAIETADAALSGVDEAVAADRLPLANGFCTLAVFAAAKAQSVPHISLAKKAEAELKLVGKEAVLVGEARETLKKSPDDAAANLTVGRYLAYRRHDWHGALPLLAKGDDAELAALAKKELADPKDAADQQKIGDDWWGLAEKEKASSSSRASLQGRAAHWYRLAAPQLTGLKLTLVTDRLKTVDEVPSTPRAVAGGNAGGAVAVAELRSIRAHADHVTVLAFAPDGKSLYSCGLDKAVRSWDLKLSKNLSTYNAGFRPNWMAFSPTGEYVVISGEENYRVCDVKDLAKTTGRTGKNLPSGYAVPGTFWVDRERVLIMGKINFESHPFDGFSNGEVAKANAKSIRAAPDNRRFVTIGREMLFCQTEATGFVTARDTTSIEFSAYATFVPRSNQVAVGTYDKKVHFVDFDSRKIVRTLEIPFTTNHLAFLPSGERFLFTGEDGNVHLCDAATGKELRRFKPGQKAIISFLVTSDASQLICGTIDGFIRTVPLPPESAFKNAANDALR